MTTSINVVLDSCSYPIRMGLNLLDRPSSWMPKHPSTVIIITDHVVKKLYALKLEKLLKEEGYNTLLLSFPAGEGSKNRQTKATLENKMLTKGCDRESVILALGGGVVGDLAGFIAATYMRGISYIQIPTTYLAMLDSSVGGKTGLNTAQGKNLIGAFWQPLAVISDIHCLTTLPQQQIINGFIEAFKIFLTSDADSLNYLQQHILLILDSNSTFLTNILQRAVQIKATVIMNDERESNQRAILNFGHTIGHAIERFTEYQLLHGYAVALGLLVEAKIAQLMGLLDRMHYQSIKETLNCLMITSDALKNFDVDEIIKNTQLDKKKHAGLVHYVLLSGLGNVYIEKNKCTHPVPDELVKRAFLDIFEE